MKKVLYGYGGHAREVMAQIGEELVCYVDDKYVSDNTKPISMFDPEKEIMMIAVGDSINRKKIKDKLPKNSKFFTFIHPTAQIMDSNIKIGEGSFIGANSIITTNIEIGKHTLLNRSVQIGHDTLIDDYFSAMPGVVISGNVKIGKQVYIGTNSSVKEKTKICDKVVIGLCSGVVKDIIHSGTYVGCPTIKL